jgi:hypothetical protein
MLVGTEAQSGAQRIVAEVTQPDVLAHLTYGAQRPTRPKEGRNGILCLGHGRPLFSLSSSQYAFRML